MKTVVIRNSRQGMIWQVYHVQNSEELAMLDTNCRANGFWGAEILYLDGGVCYHPDMKETFPTWRADTNMPVTGEDWS